MFDGTQPCVQFPDAWFPPPNSATATESRMAKRLCVEACSFTAECLERALSIVPAVEGIWGGTNDSEREAIRRQRREDEAC